MNTNAGYRPNPDNVEAALELLDAHDSGDLTVDSNSERKMRGAYLTTDEDGYPIVDIGWVSFTWTAKPRLWAVTAHVGVQLDDGYSMSRQVPTFYLDPDVQGITDAKHATNIAEEVLSTAGPVMDDHVTLNIHVEPIY